MNIRRRALGFSLAEVLITLLVATLVFLAIIGGLTYIMRGQELARERSLAHRQAAMLLEEARRKAFSQLEPISGRDVLVDDNRTPNDPDDDTIGTADLKIFRHSDGASLTNAQGEELITVQAVISWESMGKERELTLVSHFAP